MALALLIYASIATLGYMHWTDRLCPNVTETYFDDLLMQIGKMGVIISVTAGCVLLFCLYFLSWPTFSLLSFLERSSCGVSQTRTMHC